MNFMSRGGGKTTALIVAANYAAECAASEGKRFVILLCGHDPEVFLRLLQEVDRRAVIEVPEPSHTGEDDLRLIFPR